MRVSLGLDPRLRYPGTLGRTRRAGSRLRDTKRASPQAWLKVAVRPSVCKGIQGQLSPDQVALQSLSEAQAQRRSAREMPESKAPPPEILAALQALQGSDGEYTGKEAGPDLLV